jgi:hypothetical protein
MNKNISTIVGNKIINYAVDKNGIVDVPGACQECLAGQNGELDRPFGQGHFLCSPVPKGIRALIIEKRLFTRLNNNRWEVVVT